MRKKYISLLLTLLAVFTSCDDKLDITPRGFSTLNTVDDLGALINKEWRIYDWDFNHEMITGNTFALWSTPEEIFNVKNSVEYAFIYADESVDRVALCEEDDRYKEIYSNIKYCNIVACQMPDLDGDQYKKNRFIAQARILRAWFHFLAVNLWAAQYDEATAASTGGVPYVDNIDFGAEKTKLTVAQVYEKILADCSDELIECLDKTPTDDPFRFEADFGYAVRARVLFQMKRYEEAATYARKALEINPTIEDRSTIVDKGTWESTFNSPNHYMFILTSFVTNQSEMGNMTLTPKFLSLYEQGDYVRYYSREDDCTEYDDLLYGPERKLLAPGCGPHQRVGTARRADVLRAWRVPYPRGTNRRGSRPGRQGAQIPHTPRILQTLQRHRQHQTGGHGPAEQSQDRGVHNII